MYMHAIADCKARPIAKQGTARPESIDVAEDLAEDVAPDHFFFSFLREGEEKILRPHTQKKKKSRAENYIDGFCTY